jgi:hypothetical protein
MQGMAFGRKERRIAWGAATVALAAIVVGFLLDAKGFGDNALAGLAGMIFSILLAVFVVDRLLDEARARRWSLVSAETVETLQFSFVRAGLSLYLRLPAPRPAAADPYTMAIAGPAELAGALQLLGTHLRKLSDDDLARDDHWFPPEIEQEMALVRDGVMPRLLILGEADLVGAVARVEGRFQNLLHGAFLAQRFGGQHVVTAAAEFCDAMGNAVAASTSPD